MCIRDSYQDNRPLEELAIAWEGVGRLIPAHAELIKVDSISVSYTHLRAHETVLDLVCRLLLEKKKSSSKANSRCGSLPHHSYVSDMHT